MATKPCSKKSSGRALAAGSMTTKRRLPASARSKSTRMATEYGGEEERQDRPDADGCTQGMQHRELGKGEYTETDHRRYTGEDERDEGAAPLLLLEGQPVEEKRVIGPHGDHQEQSNEMKDRQRLSGGDEHPRGGNDRGQKRRQYIEDPPRRAQAGEEKRDDRRRAGE